MIRNVLKLPEKAYYVSLFLAPDPTAQRCGPYSLVYLHQHMSIHVSIFSSSLETNSSIIYTHLFSCALSTQQSMSKQVSHQFIQSGQVCLFVCFYGTEVNFKCLLQLLSKSTAGDQLSIKVSWLTPFSFSPANCS